MSDFNQQIIDEFRANDGTVSTAGFGDRLVLVHHFGAKSGTERIAPLMAIPQPDGSRLIAASAGGGPKDPAWYHNLLARPDVTIETPEGTVDVHAAEVPGPEHAEAWKQFTDASPGFADYEKKSGRTIPVIRLSPR
ncbi:MAG: nitroreductase/quinone reductase family protein [Nakamurella sp.]